MYKMKKDWEENKKNIKYQLRWRKKNLQTLKLKGLFLLRSMSDEVLDLTTSTLISILLFFLCVYLAF